MSSLCKLIYTNYKAGIRHIFSKFSTGLVAVLLVGFYVFLLVISLQSMDHAMMGNSSDNTIMMLLGILSFILLSNLFTKKKVILKEADANILFSGPYLRKEVMGYIAINTGLQSALVALYPLYFLLCFSVGTGLNLGFILTAYLFSFLTSFFFLLLSDYIHLYEIKDNKYLWLGRGITFIAILIVGLLFLFNLASHQFDFSLGFDAFLQANEFYFVPFFGWMKLALVSYNDGSILITLAMLLLIATTCGIVAYLFINYKDDFYEAAIRDAEDFTVRYAASKKGKITVEINEKKLAKSKSSFKQGAQAVFSKNVILMKRSKSLFSFQSIIMLLIFFVYSLFSKSGDMYYVSMSLFSLFMTCNDLSIDEELKNYQIYLIPDKPIKKAFACLSAQWIKTLLFILTSTVLYIVGFQPSVFSIVIFFFNQIALGLMITVSMMLSFKLMKSRNNQVIIQMLKMLTILVLLIPCIVIMVVSVMVWGTNYFTMLILPVFANVLLSVLILAWVSNIFSGCDLLSD